MVRVAQEYWSILIKGDITMKTIKVYNNEHFDIEGITAVHTVTTTEGSNVKDHCLTVYSVDNKLLDILGDRGHRQLEELFNAHDSDIIKDFRHMHDLIIIRIWWNRI